jgi:hypothetical protein
MADEKVPASKGLSQGQAGLLIAAGIVLTFGGCGMCGRHDQIGEWIGFTAFGAGVFLFLWGWLSIGKR